MKRSQFFKALAGLFVAPLVISELGANDISKVTYEWRDYSQSTDIGNFDESEIMELLAKKTDESEKKLRGDFYKEYFKCTPT